MRSAHADSPRLISAPAESASAVSEPPPPPEDPKRKKAGEPARAMTSAKHHSCAKDGDTGVCKAPPCAACRLALSPRACAAAPGL